jgi:hypothetical protein
MISSNVVDTLRIILIFCGSPIIGFAPPQTEAAIGITVLNQMLTAGHPDFVRRMRIDA